MVLEKLAKFVGVTFLARPIEAGVTWRSKLHDIAAGLARDSHVSTRPIYADDTVVITVNM